MIRKMFGLKVLEKKDEAKDAVTLVFSLPTDQLKECFKFSAGQFIGITQNINHEVVHRSYSLSSNPHERDHLAVSVKKVEGGRMSTYLVEDVEVGEELMITPPAGSFYREPEIKRHHVMFAAGSGVTPMMSILHHLTLKRLEDAVTLFYWNQSQNTTMFLDELKSLAKDKKNNFNLFLAYTQDQCDDDEVFCLERVNDENLKSCYYNWSTTLDMPLFYICGPEAFMDIVESFLSKKGYDRIQIRKESFLTGAKNSKNEPDLKDDELLVGDLDQARAKRGGDCLAVSEGTSVEVSVEEDETILEALLKAGENPPYSCMEGICMACQCKVIQGVAEMHKDSFLSEEEIKEKSILSCQAFVRSESVKVDFDDF